MNEPDPVTPFCTQLTQALREALQAAHRACTELHRSDMQRLDATSEWQQLTGEQRARILNHQGISSVPQIHVGTEDELLNSTSVRSSGTSGTDASATASRPW